MAHDEGCIDIGEQRRNVEVELPRNIRRRRRNVAERRIVLIEKLVIETLAQILPARSLISLMLISIPLARSTGPVKTKYAT